METFTSSVGFLDDPELHHVIHLLEEQGRVEHLFLPDSQVGRRRFRATSETGNVFGVVLDVDPAMIDGLVLDMSSDRAVVLHRGAAQFLRLRATTIDGGIQLGWHAGHLHWRVKFEGGDILVHLDAPEKDYVDRIRKFLDQGSITVVGS